MLNSGGLSLIQKQIMRFLMLLCIVFQTPVKKH